MNSTMNPLKRSEQLAPLSREHHDGLLFVWKLRQGLGNNTAVDTLRSFSNWFWKNHIKPHFYQEEKLLLPFLDPEDKMSLRVKKEHDDIRDLIVAIDDDPDSMLFNLLANFVETHIRFEERTVFPYLESKFSQQQLDTIFGQLEQNPISLNEWKEEFWAKKTG